MTRESTVAVRKSYEEAARRELGEEQGVLHLAAPHLLAVHEAVVPGSLAPGVDEVAWHGWLEESELFEFMRRRAFTPDSGPMLDRYLRASGQ
ncbi:hypothetical protein ACWD64_18800 [Streptomyces antibioticus]